jgi:hypothetical protein
MLYNNLIGLVGNTVFFLFALMTQEDSDASATIERMMTEWNVFRDVMLIALCGALG